MYNPSRDLTVILITVWWLQRLAVSKQAAQKFDVEIFNLGELSEVEVRKQYHIKFSNKFTALKKLERART
jgi:hypothetical protein